MRNGSPLVSFTFDDVPESAHVNGAALLDDHGIRGTFYIAAGTCGAMDTYWRVIGRDQVSDLYRRGHEIGCHTFSHRAVDQLNAPAIDEQCQRNLDTVRELCPGIELANFCYPFGCLSLLPKLQLQRHFDTCRGIYEGVNSGIIDLGLLKVIELFDRTLTRDKLHYVLRSTRARNGWVIFYTHDVAPQPTHMGCSPALLRATIDEVRQQGMKCLSVSEAVAAIGYQSHRPGEVVSSRSVSLP